jgi:hypothetical protein
MRSRVGGVLLFVSALYGSAFAQQTTPAAVDFSRKNTWTMFAEYSNDSSPILLGQSRQRKLVDLGFGYARRLVQFRGSDLAYQVELRPVLFESDPTETVAVTINGLPVTTATTESEGATGAVVYECKPASGQVTFPGNPVGSPPVVESYSITCGRQWTFGQAFSPIGFKYSMRTRHPLQPFIAGTLGYMYTSRPVPVADAEAFNFVFDFGVGVEVFRSRTRSVALECRYHHFSNRDTAEENPGVDNMMFKASYSFGR